MTAVCALLVAAVAGCSGGGGDDDSSDQVSADTTATTAPSDKLLILVTSADGLTAPGLDALVQTLYARPGTDVTVVAPTVVDPAAPAGPEPGVAPLSNFGPTTGGFPGIGVQADPAVTVSAALAGQVDGVIDGAHLVIAGINDGALLGPLAGFDADVSAAQAGVAAGLPTLVVSAGLDEVPPDYPAAVEQVVAWLDAEEDALLAREEPAQVNLLNIPGCGFATNRGLREVPVAADAAGRDGSIVDCASVADAPADDIDAFTNGFATLSVLTATSGETNTTGTTVPLVDPAGASTTTSLAPG